MSDTDRPLELSPAALGELIDQAKERLARFLEALPSMPVSDTTGGLELAKSLRESTPPETGMPVSELLDLFFDRAVPPTFNTAHPGYLAYVPGGGLPHSAVADLIAGVTNRYVTVFAAAPAVAQIEANVVSWLCHIVGYPKTARGLLSTGGSLANWTGLVTARRERLGDDFLEGTIYASDQTHHCVAKSAILAGFPEANVRSVPTDARYRIRLDALETMIAEDRARGMIPFCLVGNAGTTNTGAVDPLDDLADLALRHQLWFHVDAAYGGFFMLTAEGRKVLRGLERADSLVLDPHKGLFLPYGTGALLVKDGAALKRAHTLVADYMPHLQDDPELIDFCEHSAELSRAFRGLRVWLPVKMHGIAAFREQLEEKLALARWAADELRRIPEIEILAEPELSLLAFRLVPPGVSDPDELNRVNRRFQDRINARQRVFLTGTMLGPTYALRICIVSFRTHREHVEQALEDVRAAVETLAAALAGE